MATEKTNVYDKQTSNSGKLSPVILGGPIRNIHAEFTAGTASASGDKIMLARVPSGSMILPSSTIHFEAGIGGGTATAKIGDADDDDRYLTATVIASTATSVKIDSNRLGTKVYDSDTDIFLTVGAAGLGSGKCFTVDLNFVAPY